MIRANMTTRKPTPFDRLSELEQELGVEIVSYGLAPNSTGYCYQVLELEDLGYESQEEMDTGDIGINRNNLNLWAELDYLCNTAPQEFI